MLHRRLSQGKTCKAVQPAQCGTDTGVNTCLKVSTALRDYNVNEVQ
jgi:hypothetical protein